MQASGSGAARPRRPGLGRCRCSHSPGTKRPRRGCRGPRGIPSKHARPTRTAPHRHQAQRHASTKTRLPAAAPRHEAPAPRNQYRPRPRCPRRPRCSRRPRRPTTWRALGTRCGRPARQPRATIFPPPLVRRPSRRRATRAPTGADPRLRHLPRPGATNEGPPTGQWASHRALVLATGPRPPGPASDRPPRPSGTTPARGRGPARGPRGPPPGSPPSSAGHPRRPTPPSLGTTEKRLPSKT
mmetsp:Transcript_47182/g.119406  ORF Transcript_47182/g.119406 Transcript_47182/m.119406 type:complete len:241 (-) Transcript_47182:826-1548(-)